MKSVHESKLALLIAFAVVALLPPRGSGAAEPYDESRLRRDVRDSELIVRGVITSIRSDAVPYDSLFVQKRPGASFPVTVIEVAVQEVIKGVWERPTIDAVRR